MSENCENCPNWRRDPKDFKGYGDGGWCRMSGAKVAAGDTCLHFGRRPRQNPCRRKHAKPKLGHDDSDIFTWMGF